LFFDSEVQLENRQNRLIILGISLIGVLAFISLFSCYNRTRKSTSPSASTQPFAQATFPSITILYLDGSIIHFDCLDTPKKCFSDVDLSDPIRTLNDLNQHPFFLSSAHYGRDSMIYLNIGGSIWNYLVKISPQTNHVQILNLNVPSLSSRSDILPMFLPGGVKMIHGKIVLGTTNGKIGIVQDDFSLKTIDIGSPIRDFIEANDSKIAAVSANDGSLLNGELQAKIFLIDINSGEVEEKILTGPQARGSIVTVDKNIRNLYWVSLENKSLHLFDIQLQKDILSIPISDAEIWAYTTLTTPRCQYHGIWYIGGRCPCEGLFSPLMMTMSTLKPVINPEDFLKDEPESDRTFIIAPFGDNFLIGTHSRVLVMSPDGMVIKAYNLPKEWVGRNYLLLEYRN
jgi:hypothetical protein